MTRYTTERGIERIGYGAVVMQQQTGGCTVIRADDVRAGKGSASAQIQRVFEAADLLTDLDDLALTDLACHVPIEHRVERGLHFIEGEWRPGDALVTLAEGMGVEVRLDPLMTEVFLHVTSGATVRAAATAVGERAGVDAAQTDDLVAAAGAMVRELLALGVVVAGPPIGTPVGEETDGGVDR